MRNIFAEVVFSKVDTDNNFYRNPFSEVDMMFQCLVRSLFARDSNQKNLVFTTEFGRHINNKTLYMNYKRIMRKLGFPQLRFHDLRHTYAVVCLESGVDIKTLQENLGHATAAFTLDVYAHATNQMKKASADRMEQYIKSLQGSKSAD